MIDQWRSFSRDTAIVSEYYAYVFLDRKFEFLKP